ncbi:iron-containing alcohol dehydrogenase [Bacillus salacetis]|uniref:Iron-containing alcohol dehydrogenase n=1 Tax=Bacillus salacetis TaxID=2315464 RepID=A0A3A1QZE0_9BACI|nr:iron-containing alcohol dehydrogenase [Bacillus salacetis]RIW34279.1 iron-containing alcohol dehydrogenase [Bacillus salacetis]
MLNQYNLKMPTNVFAGPEAMHNLNVILKDSAAKIAIFTGGHIYKLGLLDEVIRIIENNGIEYDIISDIPAEPSYIQAQEVIDQFKVLNADLIIGVGGGSVMDIAKLASVLSTDDYTVKDLLDDPLLAKKQVPSLMIPTTAGTGSEATPNSIVGVPEKDLKVGIVNSELIADHVILDSSMIKNLPKPIAAATGIDALAHAIECFTSKKANPISDTFALEALDLILNNIIEACTDPNALEAKHNMLLGSFYAGVAITSSGTTAVHPLSYPLGGKYHIAHGVSNAILLTPVMKFNEPVIKVLLAKAYDRVVKEPNNELSVEEKSKYIIDLLEDIVKTLEIPTSLKTFNVPEEDLDGLVEAAMQVQRLLVNNMREVTPEDARKMYLEIM